MLARAAPPSRQARVLLAAACSRGVLCPPARPAQHHRLLPLPLLPTSPLTRLASSSTRWTTRQSRDPFTAASKLAGLKSRAAYKLLEIDSRHHLFSPGDSVVDLGYAPGSWSQVAKAKVGEEGRVVGVDVVPVQPPRGVSTLMGDFLSEGIQGEVRAFVRGQQGGRGKGAKVGREGEGWTEEELEERGRGVVARLGEEGKSGKDDDAVDGRRADGRKLSQKEVDGEEGRVVNVVLSDMCEPWPLAGATWVRSVSNPYRRMMNTSGMAFRDHAGSMDLCNAALTFAFDTLVTGGHFLCKFYQGAEDHAFEQRLKKLFEKVHRIKPDSSRKESREAYFVCLRRRGKVGRGEVFPAEDG